MADHSTENPRVPSFLRLVIAVECTVVLAAAILLFFLPGLAADLWPWKIPPFNARFVGAVYFAAYIPLILFWFTPRWTPGRLTLWLILTFTAAILVVMVLHRDTFEWDRPATYLVYWPLYIFLPINSALFLLRYKEEGFATGYDGSPFLRVVLWGFSLLGAAYGFSLLIAPEPLTAFWPWPVDAFHGRIYAAAFVTPAVGAWLLSRRRQASMEYLSMGLNLAAGGFLPILGTLWTNTHVPAERQVGFSSAGPWAFFMVFFLTGLLGIALTLRVRHLSK